MSVPVLHEIEVHQRPLLEPDSDSAPSEPPRVGAGLAHLEEHHVGLGVHHRRPRQAGAAGRSPKPPSRHTSSPVESFLAYTCARYLASSQFVAPPTCRGRRSGPPAGPSPRGCSRTARPPRDRAARACRAGKTRRPPPGRTSARFHVDPPTCSVNASRRRRSSSLIIEKRTPMPKLEESGTFTTSPSQTMGRRSPGKVNDTVSRWPTWWGMARSKKAPPTEMSREEWSENPWWSRSSTAIAMGCAPPGAARAKTGQPCGAA